MLILMPSPTKLTFESTEKVFCSRWNFPNVVGCLDGKHVRMRCPNKTGSLYFNYKNYFSMILFALTDANCKFMAIDVGSFGREGDAGNIFANNFLNHNFEMNNHLDRYFPKIENRTMHKKPTLRLAKSKTTSQHKLHSSSRIPWRRSIPAFDKLAETISSIRGNNRQFKSYFQLSPQ